MQYTGEFFSLFFCLYNRVYTMVAARTILGPPGKLQPWHSGCRGTEQGDRASSAAGELGAPHLHSSLAENPLGWFLSKLLLAKLCCCIFKPSQNLRLPHRTEWSRTHKRHFPGQSLTFVSVCYFPLNTHSFLIGYYYFLLYLKILRVS